MTKVEKEGNLLLLDKKGYTEMKKDKAANILQK